MKADCELHLRLPPCPARPCCLHTVAAAPRCAALASSHPPMLKQLCMHLCPDDYLFILVLIGDSGVGKSCLLLRFAVSRAPDPTSATRQRCRAESWAAGAQLAQRPGRQLSATPCAAVAAG